MIPDKVKSLIQQSIQKLKLTEPVAIDIPIQQDFGDFATSIALKATKVLKKSPLVIAQEIIDNIPKNSLIVKTQIIKPGFINIWVNPQEFMTVAEAIAQEQFNIPSFHFGTEKKIMVEFAHPNTLKLLHIGHMRNISTGEAMVRLFEAVGNTVIRTNYQGDVGLHIAKTIWKVREYFETMGKDAIESLTLREKISLLGKAYAEAEKAYSTDDKAKREILDINRMVYENNPGIIPLWKETREWSLQYFSELYSRVYTHFDRFYFESECHKRGTVIASELLKKGVLEKSQGAVVLNGKAHGVDTRVFINSQGFPTYEGKELALAEMEFRDFGTLDKNIHVVTPEQTSFFQVTFKVEELIDPATYKNKQYHLAYNWVKLKQGKMSSRLGNVIEGEWLLDEAKKRLSLKYKLDPLTAETLAVAAVKYSFLKVSPQVEIYFDFEESISLEGNSAPYLIYTYVRTQSVLKKNTEREIQGTNSQVNEDEKQLLRKISQYANSVYESASRLSPNILSTYLFELCQIFNLFYQKNPILKADINHRQTRIIITKAVGNIIQHGLNLLGIKTVTKM